MLVRFLGYCKLETVDKGKSLNLSELAFLSVKWRLKPLFPTFL